MFCKFNVSERPCFIQIQWRIEEDTGSQPLDPKHPDMQMHPHACEHTSTDTYTYIIHMKKIKKRCGRVIGSLVSLIFTLQYNFFLSDLLSYRNNFFLQAVIVYQFSFSLFPHGPLRCCCLHSWHSILPMLSGFPTMSFFGIFHGIIT